MMRRVCLALAFWAAALSAAGAHELRPAFLDMRETAENSFSLLWKVPAQGDRRMQLDVVLPDRCRQASEPTNSVEGNYWLTRWQAECAGGLGGDEIVIGGLRTSLTDALVRIEYLDGSSEVARLTPEKPIMAVRGVMGPMETAATYFMLGVEHILSGIDHLLFVLALMLLIRDRWMLLKTITAFTVAHSITLAGAALGYLSAPQPPVEAAIALSIVFLARELVLERTNSKDLAWRSPWIVAFAFGLLHGFGFAGALREIGLPPGDVPLALLSFNLGVEAGQVLFVVVMLVAYRAVSALVDLPRQPARRLMAYGIGTLSTLWLLERLVAFAA
jgi:hydrogenase/urease accessory protein HupE